MSFFEEADSAGIVEDHINKVLKLEDSQQEIILKQYKSIRQELVDKLSSARAGSFTHQHLAGVLAQVQGAISAMTSHLSGDMIEGSKIAALQGIDHLIKEINFFDKKFVGAVTPINLNAALLANDTANLLVTRYKTNLDAYGANILAQVTNGLFSATLGETSYDEVVGRVANFFNGEEWKLRRIVRTELHGLYNRGKIAGMQELKDDITDLKKTLIHPMDARTGDDSKYAASKHLVADMDKPFRYKWNDEWREFQVPPDRPNDRSVMVPYREEWGEADGSALLPGKFNEA